MIKKKEEKWGAKQEPQTASPISFTLGVLWGPASCSSLSQRADQYQESGHYAPFESATCTIDMLLFFICWLYLIPSLLFPLPEQAGSYSHPNLNHLFLFFLGSPRRRGGMCGWLPVLKLEDCGRNPAPKNIHSFHEFIIYIIAFLICFKQSITIVLDGRRWLTATTRG